MSHCWVLGCPVHGPGAERAVCRGVFSTTVHCREFVGPDRWCDREMGFHFYVDESDVAEQLASKEEP